MTFTRFAVVGTIAAVLGVLGCNGATAGKTPAKSTVAPSTSGTPGPVTSSNPPAPVPSSATTGPTVALATYVDVNKNGSVDAGDQVVITFNKEVALNGASAGDFVLPVTGDRFGQAATVTSGTNPTDVVVTLGQGSVLTINGTFSATVTKAGSPSGVDVAAAQKSIKDVKGNLAVPSRVIDITTTATPPPPPPPPPSTAFKILSASFADVNSSGKIDAGDTITLALSDDVVLGTGSNAPSISDFALPVSGDAFGLAAFVKAGTKANEVVIVVGANATLTLTGTFDKTKTATGAASGVGAGPTLTAAKLASKNGNKPLGTDAIDIDGTLAPPTGPHLTYVKFKDNNSNGKIDSGDVITLGFSSDVDIGYGSAAPSIAHLTLPVMGDVLDPATTIGYGAGFNEVDIRIAGSSTVLNPNGLFDPATTAAGSPSGLGLAASLPPGAIFDFNTGQDVATGTVLDVDGTLVAPKPPVVVSAFWVDRDLDGKASAGDSIVVELNEPVRVDTTLAKPSDFALPVSGDSFGAGAKVQGGPRPTEVTIVLGTNPNLTIKGSFDKSKLSSGAASGVDVAANPTPGAIVDALNVDMAPATIAWDIQEPVGALDNPMSNDSVNDAAATTADWNVASSGKVVASRKLDVGAGTDALVISSDTTIDTTTGKIGGTKSPAFKGAGVFEYATIDVKKGVTVTVTGHSPLVLKASQTASVDGTFLMDGKKGDDNLTTYGGAQGFGGRGGPGGFDGGNGAKGGGLDITPGDTGIGPCGGFGGGSDSHSGGAGGAGFAVAGKPGTDGSATSTGPGAKGGLGGPQASAAQLSLVPFVGGSGGGGGGALQRPTPTTPATSAYTAPGAGGGGGGGAFRLAANGVVKFGGKVSVNGGNGGSGGGLTGGGAGGGGAGGSVLVESNADVILAPSASFSARGGQGGSGTNGGDGSDGVVLVEANGQVKQLPAAVTGVVRPAPSEATVAPTLAAGSGMDDLAVDQTAILDTDKGLLNGVALPSFRGAGVFEVRNFTVASGATLAIVGTSTLTIRASGSVDVAGTIDLNGQNGQAATGLNGGLGGKGRAGGKDGGMGGSLTLSSTQGVASSIAPKDGSGAGAGTAAGNGDAAGGAGGSFGSFGMSGLSSSSSGKAGKAATATYGTADLATLAGGSGAGGGAANLGSGKYEGGGGGGAGGGAIAIEAKGDIRVSGVITANGGDGGASIRGGDGGAGSGGAIALRSLGTISVTGSLSAIGGDGKTVGGAGGNGRIRLEDTVGSFTQGTITPKLTTGTFTTSVAVSKWIRTQAGSAPAVSPRYMAILATGSATGGSSYAVEVESAKDSSGAPDVTTATGFQSDARQLAGEWVRFRVTLKLGTGSGAAASVDRVFAPFK